MHAFVDGTYHLVLVLVSIRINFIVFAADLDRPSQSYLAHWSAYVHPASKSSTVQKVKLS